MSNCLLLLFTDSGQTWLCLFKFLHTVNGEEEEEAAGKKQRKIDKKWDHVIYLHVNRKLTHIKHIRNRNGDKWKNVNGSKKQLFEIKLSADHEMERPFRYIYI